MADQEPQELKKTGDFDEAKMEELRLGEAAVVSILNNVNSFIKKEERTQAVEELRQQVEDWKGHELGGFGDLLMHGSFPVQKAAGQQDREVSRFRSLNEHLSQVDMPFQKD